MGEIKLFAKQTNTSLVDENGLKPGHVTEFFLKKLILSNELFADFFVYFTVPSKYVYVQN